MATYENTAQYVNPSDLLADTREINKVNLPKKVEVKYANYVPPAKYKQWDAEKVKNFLKSCNSLVPQKALELPGGKAQFKFTGKYQQTKVNNELYKMLVSVNKDVCIKAQSMVGFNGSLEGQLVRKLETTPKVKPVLKTTDDEFLYLKQNLFNAQQTRKVEVSPSFSAAVERNDISINVKAGAGFPYIFKDEFAQTGTYFKDMYKRATEYMVLLSKGKDDKTAVKAFLDSLMVDNPSELTLLMKRKLDRYERTCFRTKARSYFVYPGALKLLMLPIAEYVRRSIVKFDDPEAHENNGVAYKFSWVGGGVKRLQNWIESCKEGQFKHIAYGDDAVWVYRHEGQLFVMCPDITGMDTSLSGDILSPIMLSLFINISEEMWFRRVLLLTITVAFNMNVHVAYALVYRFLWGLFSGHPLTTVFDTLMSCIVGVLVRHKLMLQAKAKLNPLDFDLVQYVKHRTGMQIKLTTYGWVKYDSLESLPPFLGMVIRKFKDSYVPVRYEEDIATSLIIPKSTTTSNTKEEGTRTLERVAGCYITGGWYYDTIREVSEEYFTTRLPIHKPSYLGETEIVGMPSVVEVVADYPTLPSPEAMVILFDEGTDAYRKYRIGNDPKQNNDVEAKVVVAEVTQFSIPDTDWSVELPTIPSHRVKPEKMDKLHARTAVEDVAKRKEHEQKLERWMKEKALRRERMANMKFKGKGKIRREARDTYYDELIEEFGTDLVDEYFDDEWDEVQMESNKFYDDYEAKIKEQKWEENHVFSYREDTRERKNADEFDQFVGESHLHFDVSDSD